MVEPLTSTVGLAIISDALEKFMESRNLLFKPYYTPATCEFVSTVNAQEEFIKLTKQPLPNNDIDLE